MSPIPERPEKKILNYLRTSLFIPPPYYIKKEKAYREKATEETPSISFYTKEEYENFLKGFFLLAHKKSKATTRMAFLNADWRDFESTPARQTYFRNCWKNLANRKKIIMKPRPRSPLSLIVENVPYYRTYRPG